MFFNSLKDMQIWSFSGRGGREGREGGEGGRGCKQMYFICLLFLWSRMSTNLAQQFLVAGFLCHSNKKKRQ